MWISIAHDKSIDRWIAERHYLESSPWAATIRMWFLEGNKKEFVDDTKKLGAMLWNHPTARALNQDMLLELTRMYFVDDTEPNIESKALAMARRWIRKNRPEIKGLLAYSSEGMNHQGTVYLADGWFTLYKTNGSTWEGRKNRESRVDRDTSKKILWVRTP